MNQIQKTRKLNIDRNKGFTLVEMIVVLAMMAIVMTLTVFGILAWQDWADFNRENEYAETLFVAAQNQLAEFSANGRLQEMKASLYGFDSIEEYKIANENPDLNLQIGNEYKYGNGKENDALELNTTRLHRIKNVDGVSYNEVNVWPEAYKQKKNQSNYTDKIVSLRAEAGQYNEYLNDPDAFKKKDLDAYWLFEILGDYVYDTSIIAGSKNSGTAICLEFTISNGQVFSALYSDKNDCFWYDSFEPKVTSDRKYADISDRSEMVRKENMVGYYGVDTLYAATPTDVEKPGISYVALIDDNYYYLKMRLSERYRNKTGELDYTIDLNGSKNQEDKVMTIEIANGQLQNMDPNRTTLAERAEYALTNHGTITGQVTLYGEDGITPKMEADGVMPKKLDYEFIGWVDSDYYIHLILDAADMQAQTNLYKDEFSTILAGSENQNFDKTFSYFRFGVPIKNLWVSVTAEGDGVPRSKTVSNFGNINPTKNQSATNPVYQLKKDYVQGGKLAVTYDISNPRHLYNIRYNSDITLANRQLRDDFYYDKEEKAYASTDVSGITYNLKNDIAWAEFQQAGYLMNGYADTKYYKGINPKNCDYPSYAQMNVKDVFEGNNFKVSGISLSKAANLKYGSTKDLSPKMKENEEYISSVSDNCPTGLVNVNYGTIQNMKLDNIRVSGDSMVGAFAGVNAGKIERLTTVKNAGSFVQGTKNVGGIIGFEIPTDENTTIQFCENNVSVTGQEAVGGIIGMVRNDFTNIIRGTNIQDNPILEGAKDSLEVLNRLNSKTGVENLSIIVNRCDNYGPVQGEYKQMYQVTGKKDDSSTTDSTFVVQDFDVQTQSGKKICKIQIDNKSDNPLKVLRIEIELDTALRNSDIDNGEANVKIDGKKLTITPKSGKENISVNGSTTIGFDLHKNVKAFIIKDVKIVFEDSNATSSYGNSSRPDFVDGSVGKGGTDGGNVVKVVKPTSGDHTNIRYFGGIVGYCYNQFDDPAKVSIRDCTSCPQYEDSWLFDVLGDDAKLSKYLNGYYVGGIVGYNHYGEIKVCTSKSAKVAHGYIFGEEYVGGIVGLNIGPASGIEGGTSGKQGSNANNVIGNKYAGGIVGCNSNIQDKDSLKNPLEMKGDRPVADPEKLEGLLLPDTTTCLNVKIDNWLNEGVVIAKDAYSGGISGYNAGWIYNCNTKITEADANRYFNKLYTQEYAGGIAGYNNGVIGNTDREIVDAAGSMSKKKSGAAGSEISIRSYVRGRNYVGGIVGYNDVDAIVENYKVAGGYVYGDMTGCYVGGYAGFNASIDLLMDTESKMPRSIKSNPNNVEGGYFVGGIIGGNIINTDGYKVKTGKSNIEALFETDNFLGTLTGNAYVGGFVGYSMLVDDKAVVTDIASLPEGDRGLVYLLQNSVVEKFHKVTTSAGDETKKLHDMTRYLDELQDNFVSASENKVINGKKINSDVTIHMTGEDHHTKNSLGTISSKIYVGGVAGYVDGNTALYVESVDNATPIIATSAIEYLEQQPLYVMQKDGTYQKEKDVYRTKNYAGVDFKFKYSYAGGIVGKVGAKTIIDSCSNVSLGRVTTYGTYTGGICEVNEGTIINCQVTNIGNGATDYVGGLCGLNLNMIQDCKVKNQTVTGRNVVGAIVAENFGTIQNIELDGAKIMAYSSSVSHNDVATGKHFYSEDGVSGLLAGYNGNAGIISLEKDIKNVSVQSKGRYVGLAVGFNDGSVSNNKLGAVTADKFKAKTKEQYVSNCVTNLTISGTIEGRMTVGSLIGCNNDANPKHNIYNYTNLATVKSSYGEAGGLIGVNSSANTMMFCENKALVVATDSGNAGGLTSINDGTIAKCFDYNAVSAPNGMCGGIVALNDKNGNIYDCFVEPDSKAKSAEAGITFTSTQVVGGIAAQNGGTISGNFLKKVTITNDTTKMYTQMGVVVGENLNTGKILLSNSSNLLDGTVAEIEACKVVVESNNCKVGGIAGTNAGQIEGTILKNSTKPTISDNQIMSLVNCDLQLKGATYAAMGGVAGVNTGSIKNISVDATIQGNLGTADSGYGGIAGVSGSLKKGSGQKALISNCSFDGKISAKGSSGMLARVGGIAGINAYDSKIEYCGLGVRTGSGSDRITEVTAGDISKGTTATTTDKESSSYTGGIAGENYGHITDVDGVASTKDAEVKIIAFTGSTGGVVGHNCRGAVITGYVVNKGKSTEKVHRLSTGENWYVEMKCAENNRGPGGIIGLNESGKDMDYVDNYAHVVGSYNANIKTGGFIGENMQTESYQLHLSNCNNFGDIDAWANTGGFFGHNWFRGTSFTDCRNYGAISILKDSTGAQRYVGGFIGRITATETTMSFVNCENHGKIYNNYASKPGCIGGFIGQADQASYTSYMTNCVNTGLIERADGGIELSGGFIGDCRSVWEMNLCRNYNTNKTKGGFISGSNATVNIRNSLDVSMQSSDNTKYTPFGGFYANSGTKSVNNYYIANKPFSGTEATIMFLEKNYPENDIRVEFTSAKSNLPVIALKKNDPVDTNNTYVNDKNQVAVSKKVTKGIAYVDWDEAGNADVYSTITDSRISVYKELDKAFVNAISKMNNIDNKLSAPKNVNIYVEKGRVYVKWDKVTTDISGASATPYGYEVSYVIRDQEGNSIKEKSEIQAADGSDKEIWHSPLSIETEWMENNYYIEIQVRATSFYHFSSDGNESKDSDWAPEEAAKYVFSGDQLLRPEIHIELTAGNKFVAVLDNIEDYEKYQVMVKNEAGEEVAMPMSEVCTIKVTWFEEGQENNASKCINYSIEPGKSMVSTEAKYVTGKTTFRRAHANAVPLDEYKDSIVESDQFVTVTEGYLSDTLPSEDLYTAEDNFYGFYGTDPDSMIYEISMKNGGDSFIATDIGGYCEEVGTYVYYGREITHVGKNDGGDVYKVSTLKNLPKEWFDEDAVDSIEARTYIDSSQNKFVHYGHDVAKNITLYKESVSMNLAEVQTKNIEILKSIKDKYYLKQVSGVEEKVVDDISKFLQENISIWDDERNDLRYGYVLCQNEDGTYDIIYNASIELSRQNADKYNDVNIADKGENDRYWFTVPRKYYKYAVDVLIYDSRKLVDMPIQKKKDNNNNNPTHFIVPEESVVNVEDYNESYVLRRQKTEKSDSGYSNIRMSSAEVAKNQDILPIPIIDKDAEGNDITIIENGNTKEYKVSWDKYYRDVATDSKGNYILLSNGNLGVKEGYDVYNSNGENYYISSAGREYFYNEYDGYYYYLEKDPKTEVKVFDGKYIYAIYEDAFYDEELGKFFQFTEKANQKVFMETDADGMLVNNGIDYLKYNGRYRYTKKDRAFFDYNRGDIYYFANAPKTLLELNGDGILHQKNENYILYNGEYYYSTADRSFYSEDEHKFYYFKSVPKVIYELDDSNNLVPSEKYYVLHEGEYYYTQNARAFFDDTTGKYYICSSVPKTPISYYNGKFVYSTVEGAVLNEITGKYEYYVNGVLNTVNATIANPEATVYKAIEIPAANRKTAICDTDNKAATDRTIFAKKASSAPQADNTFTSWWQKNSTFGRGMYAQSDLQYLTMAGRTMQDADGNDVELMDFPTWKAFRERTALYDDFIDLLYSDTYNDARRDYCKGMMNSYYIGYDTASYKVELIGITDAGKEVVLETKYVSEAVEGEKYNYKYVLNYKVNGVNNGTKKTRYGTYETKNYEITFVDNEGSWEKYKKVSVRIMRLGQDRNVTTRTETAAATQQNFTYRSGILNANGKIGTFMLPRYTTIDVVQRQRLDTVDTPDAEMTQINGQFITEYPSYDISWMLNTDEQQLKDLAGYLLKIEDASKEDILPSTYYYIPENESYQPDYKSLTISANELAYLLDNVTDIKVDRNDETHTNTVSVNFVEYAGRNVKVTVRAMAREDDESNPRLYLNGYASTAKEITIKDSLSAPDVSLLKLAVADDSEKETELVIPASEDAVAGMPDFANAKTIIGEDANQETIEHAVDSETYEKGFTFHYVAGADKTISANYADENKQDVKLNIAIALYDSKDDASATDKSRGKAGDAESVSENGYWNSGAIKTLYSKSEPFHYGYVRFDGVADTESNVSLTALEEYVGLYAGKWMKIALQATSESNIDSLWSDEDRGEMTQNYIWIQIPKMILKDVDLSVGSAERWYHETIIEKDGQSSIVSTLDRDDTDEFGIHFFNRTLSFEEDQNADGWHIGISVKAPKPEDSVSGNDAPSGTTSGNSASGNNAPSGSASGNSESGDNEPSSDTSGNGTLDGNSSDNGVSDEDKEAKEKPTVLENDNHSTDRNSEAEVDDDPEEIKDSDNSDEPEQKKFWVAEFFENLFYKSDSESEEVQVKEAQTEEITESQTEETQIKESNSDEVQEESEIEETQVDEAKEIKVVEAQEEKPEDEESKAEEAEVKKTVVISGQVYEVREVEDDIEESSDSEKPETISDSNVNELSSNKVEAKESEDDTSVDLENNNQIIKDDESEDSISDNQLPEDDVQDVLAGEEPEDPEEILPLYELYFDKHVAEDGIFDGTWDVFIAAGNDETTVSVNAAADGYTCSQNSVAVYLGTIGTSTITEAPAEVQYISIPDVAFDITIEHLTYHMYAELVYDGDKKEFTLILPDVAGFDADDNYDESVDCYAVEQVVVEKLVSPDSECYVRGLSGGFERSKSQEEEGIFVYQTLDMYKSDVEKWYEKKRKVQ